MKIYALSFALATFALGAMAQEKQSESKKTESEYGSIHPGNPVGNMKRHADATEQRNKAYEAISKESGGTYAPPKNKPESQGRSPQSEKTPRARAL